LSIFVNETLTRIVTVYNIYMYTGEINDLGKKKYAAQVHGGLKEWWCTPGLKGVKGLECGQNYWKRVDISRVNNRGREYRTRYMLHTIRCFGKSRTRNSKSDQ
jgi:hypothetical protein